MAADVFNFSEARNLWILTSQNPENPESSAKKSLAGCSLFFFRLVIITVSPAYWTRSA